MGSLSQNVDTHKAIQLLRFDSVNPSAACTLSRGKTPRAGAGQALIRMLCSPVHPADLLAVRGLYPLYQPRQFPHVPGFEGMGLIHEVGKDVQHLKVNQRVAFIAVDGDQTGEGSWQEFVLVDALKGVIPLPDSIDNETGAQLFTNPLTVYGLFESLQPAEGDYVLQSGAGSVVGRMFIQLCRAKGVKTINLVRRNEQKEELKALGADLVINFMEENVLEVVKEATAGKMACGAVDCIGGNLTKQITSCVRDCGTILIYGKMASEIADVKIDDLLFRDVRVHGWYVGFWVKTKGGELARILMDIIGLLDSKILGPLVGEKVSIEKYEEAFQISQNKIHGEKVLLVIED